MFKKPQINGFHESYYDHPCLIATESDVLNTDIVGLSWTASYRRMWYDLFLLSYSDDRAGDYYHSTHAMRLERKRHFQRHRDCIHPLSKFRHFWDIFMLYAFILYKFFVLIATSIIFSPLPTITYYFAMLFEGFMISDIFINTRTGYIDSTNKRVVLDGQLILLHYCSTTLFFHVVSSIPFVCIMFLRYGNDISCVICKANHFNCVISFLTIISLIRVYELSSYWKRDRISFKKTVFCNFLRIGVMISLILIQFLHYSDTISLLRVMHTSPDEETVTNRTFFNDMFSNIHIAVHNKSDMFYVNAHFWRIVNFLARPSMGMTDLNLDRMYAVIYPHPLFKAIAYGLLTICILWLGIEFLCFITRETMFDDEIYRSKRYLQNLAKSHQLSERTHGQFQQYFQFNAAKMKLIEQSNGLYRSLPKILQDEISWHSFGRLIIRIPYFSDWPKEVIEKFVIEMKEKIYLKNDLVAEVGVQGEGLMIVDTGVLAVYTSQNEEVGHLIDGDYFGELSLVTDKEVRTSSVIAASHCKVLLLEKFVFRQLMRSYPSLFYSLQEQLKNEYKTSRSSSRENK